MLRNWMVKNGLNMFLVVGDGANVTGIDSRHDCLSFGCFLGHKATRSGRLVMIGIFHGWVFRVVISARDNMTIVSEFFRTGKVFPAPFSRSNTQDLGD